jgi:predicted methyltransferase MtxX (methanogen marker protein 4)
LDYYNNLNAVEKTKFIKRCGEEERVASVSGGRFATKRKRPVVDDTIEEEAPTSSDRAQLDQVCSLITI